MTDKFKVGDRVRCLLKDKRLMYDHSCEQIADIYNKTGIIYEIQGDFFIVKFDEDIEFIPPDEDEMKYFMKNISVFLYKDDLVLIEVVNDKQV